MHSANQKELLRGFYIAVGAESVESRIYELKRFLGLSYAGSIPENKENVLFGLEKTFIASNE